MQTIISSKSDIANVVDKIFILRDLRLQRYLIRETETAIERGETTYKYMHVNYNAIEFHRCLTKNKK